jgi:hypothetical protein
MQGRPYRLVVEGELGPRFSNAFEGMTVSTFRGHTALVGTIRDQAHLQGVLQRISALGLTLLSAQRIEQP